MSHHDVTVKWMTSAQRLESNMSRIMGKYEKMHAEPSTLCSLQIGLPTFDDDEADSVDPIDNATKVSLPSYEMNDQVESFIKSNGRSFLVFGANDQVFSLVAPDINENVNDDDDASDKNFESDCDDSTSEIEPDLNDLASELTYLTSFRTMRNSQQYQAESCVDSLTFLTSFQDLDIRRENANNSKSPPSRNSSYHSPCSHNTITNSPTSSAESSGSLENQLVVTQEIQDKQNMFQTFKIHGLGTVHVPFLNNQPNLILNFRVPIGYASLAEENVPSENLILRNFIKLEEEIDSDLRDIVKKYVDGLKFDFLIQYLGSSLLMYQKIDDEDSVVISVVIDSKRLQTLLIL